MFSGPRNRKRRAVCIPAGLLAAISLAACSNPRTESTVSGRPVTLTIGYSYLTGETPLHGIQQAARLVSYEGLTSQGRDGLPLPRLAKSWTESNDGLTWKIELRPSAVFHDGSKVDSEAVKRSLDLSIASSNRDLTPGLADVVNIEAPSPLEIVLRLRGRSTFLLDDLTVPILKRAENGSVFGTGPFVTTSTSNEEVVMSAVDNYYKGKPAIDRIVWRAYPAVRAAWAAMMRGDVDFLYEVSPDTLEFIEPETSVQVFSFLRNYVYAVVFNNARPIFRHSDFKRALNHAINREVLIQRVFRGKGVPANGPTWPLHWAYDSSIPQHSFDPSRATALLDAANVQTRLQTKSSEAPARARFTCLLPENFALWERMALLVQRDLSHIGIEMKIELVPFTTFNRRISVGDFDAVILEMIAGNSVSRPYFFWHSASSINTWGYKNPSSDAALDRIRRAQDNVEYKNAFRDFQVQQAEQPPAIFLALGSVTRAVSKRFRVVAPPGTDILPTIGDWQPVETAEAMSN